MLDSFRHNLTIKLLSFGIAIGIWMFAQQIDPIEERSIQFQLTIHLDPDAALVERNPNDRSITGYVTGPRSQLDALQRGIPVAVLDARGIEWGVSREITPKLESLHRGLKVNFQKNFLVVVNQLVQQSFIPEELGDGMLQSGYYIDQRIGVPVVIFAEGAVTLMDRLDRVIYHLNLASLTGSTELSVEFIAVDENMKPVENISLTPASADIAISLQPSQTTKRVPIVVDYQGTPASDYALLSLSSDPFLVDVTGPVEYLAQVNNVHTRPINLTGKTTSFSQTVELLVGASGVSLLTSTATISVVIEQIQSSSVFEDILIDVRGMNSRYSYELSTERVSVTIRGGVERVAQVTSDLIKPSIDVTNLGEGTHEVNVIVNVPAGVTSDSINPPKINVVITANSDQDNSAEQTPE